MAAEAQERLEALLRELPAAAIAVSGGVDSMTLAHLAQRVMGDRVTIVHAVSPAVPAAASARVRAHGARYLWRLRIIDAGELADPDYRRNPADRCFFCKQNLYGSLQRLGIGLLLSGTNTDDLADYRPGLKAAAAHSVRHPFVEAGIDKAGIRAIAAGLGLDDLAVLPASPCLSSRIETGIAIEPQTLGFIDAVETSLAPRLQATALRCRVRARGIVIELDSPTLATLDAPARDSLLALVRTLAPAALAQTPIAIEPYRQGSAFLRADA